MTVEDAGGGGGYINSTGNSFIDKLAVTAATILQGVSTTAAKTVVKVAGAAADTTKTAATAAATTSQTVAGAAADAYKSSQNSYMPYIIGGGLVLLLVALFKK